MSIDEQRRAWVVTRVVAGDLTVGEAAHLLGLAERSVWRLKARFLRDGPAGLVHANRGRPSSRRIDDATRDRIRELASGAYDGANDCHLTELLAERDGLVVSRVSVRRILRAAGIASPRHRRPSRHRSRRDRMPQAGLLLQTDGSRHDWLGERGPRLTLVAAIDDATGVVTGATFREQEDVAGYLTVLRDTIRRHGVPVAVYRDRHGIFETPRGQLLTLEEQLVDRRTPTQFGRALAELGISSIAARGGRYPDRGPGAGALRAALQPSLRGARSRPVRGLAAAARRARPRPGVLPQVPADRGPRQHRTGRRHRAPAAGGARPAQLRRSAGRAPPPARRPPGRLGRRADGPRASGAGRCPPVACAGPRARRGRDTRAERRFERSGGHASVAPSQPRIQTPRDATAGATDRFTDQVTDRVTDRRQGIPRRDPVAPRIR
jgi:transposase